MATEISTLAVKVAMTSAEFDAGAGKVGKSADALKGKLSGFATAAVGIGAGIAAAVASGEAVKTFAGYEQGLANVRASANLSTAELGRVSDAALKLSTETGQGPTELVSGMNELLKAGLSVDEVLGGAAGAVAKFSKVAELTTGESATVLNDAINSFSKDGLNAAGAGDIISKAADASSISVAQVAQAFSQVSAVAALAGQNMRDTANAIAVLGNNGVKGSDAGTSLKTMLVSLLAPTETGAAVIEKYGLAFRDATGQIKPFRGVVAELQRGLGGLDIASQQAALKNLFGTDALRAGAILLQQGVKGWDSFNGKIEESLGVNEKYSKINDTVTGGMAAASAAAERLGIAVGGLVAGPIARAISFGAVAVGLLEKLANASGGIAGGTVKFAAALVAGVAAALAFVKIASLIVSAYQAIAKAQTITLALSGPKGWAALAVGTVVAVASLAVLSGAFDGVSKSATDAAAAAEKVAAAAGGGATAAKPPTPDAGLAQQKGKVDAARAELKSLMAQREELNRTGHGSEGDDLQKKIEAAASLAQSEGELYAVTKKTTAAIAEQKAAADAVGKASVLSPEGVEAMNKALTERVIAEQAARKASADNAAEIQKQVEAYSEEASLVGLSADQIELHKLAVKGATAEQLRAAAAALSFKSAMEGAIKQTEAGREITRGLEEQAATAGLTGTALELYKLQKVGATAAELDHARALAATIDAMTEQKKKTDELRDAGKQLAEAVLSPWEKLEADLKRIQDVAGAGFLTSGQAEKASAHALGEALRANGSGPGGSIRTDAREMRFTEGFRQEKQTTWQDKLVELAGAGNKLTGEMKKLLAAILAKPELVVALGGR